MLTILYFSSVIEILFDIREDKGGLLMSRIYCRFIHLAEYI